MNITTCEMSPKSYVATFSEKTNIVLHSSFSRTRYTFTAEQCDERSLVAKWNIMSDKYGGHYAVGRDGDVLKCIDEDYWSHHLGTEKKYLANNKSSIAVFLVNESYLEKENGKMYAFGFSKPHNEYGGRFFEKSFQGYRYWADYDIKQIDTLCELVKDVCARHGIPLSMYRDPTKFDYQAANRAGIVSCANLNRDSRSLPLASWALERIESHGIVLVG